ncbi:MAG: bifunctional [glutamine synthetase] adenylyltransferase/[glutamine synthetase]-adenylyl-L-tyrosine phosphorylase [Hyphomicrobiales bacterium]
MFPLADARARAAARPFIDDLRMRAGGAGEEAADAENLLACLGQSPRHETLLNAIFYAAPFLRDTIMRDPGFTAVILAAPDPAAILDGVIADLAAQLAAASDEKTLKETLRCSRLRMALGVGLLDLGNVWTAREVSEGLSAFADAAVGGAVDWLIRDSMGKGAIIGLDPRRPGRGSHYIVLAMGKYGARELNYSSDIDLVVSYDPKAAPLAADIEASRFFVRLTRKLVQALQDRTAQGYVFRVDLRLRPDPRATNVAIAVETVARYYENFGQNWERAAMIKARPVAGDLAAGAALLGRLSGFIWRKHLDFAAILDVQSLKRQMHSAKGCGSVAVRGHNIKLGRGGIREIELFVQTQQLIAGGRTPALRGRMTLEMLDMLAQTGWIAAATADEMKAAYRFLRAIEHRLQMVNDEQTHSLPTDEDVFSRFVAFAGYIGDRAFETALESVLKTVERHYSALFEHSSGLGACSSNLVFTGTGDDPGTLETLSRLGFVKVLEIAATIRSWHFSRFPATRSARSRGRLTEIMPALLRALSKVDDPDGAFFAFDRFLSGLPSGVQIFSLLWSNPKFLDLIAMIMGTSPRLARELSRRPQIFDAVLDPDFFGPFPKAEAIAHLVEDAFDGAAMLEERLDRARIIGHEQMFRIGVRVLSDTVDAAEAGCAYTRLADRLAAQLFKACRDEFAQVHGHLPGGEAVVLALGKWGGCEMTAKSDLDMILIYETADDAAMSDGPKPLMAGRYYVRLTKRLVAALCAPSAEGILYTVDMRLRPSGKAGPLATHIASFATYHKESAWGWERMALTRARIVAGDARLSQEVEKTISAILRQPCSTRKLRRDVGAMRRHLIKEFGARGRWDIKHARGGLTDIEFITQFLQLAHGARHEPILHHNTATALKRLAGEGLLGAAPLNLLLSAHEFYQRLTQVMGLCMPDGVGPEKMPRELVGLLLKACYEPDLSALESRLADTKERVFALFENIVAPITQ